jgi:sulfur-carrier protein
MTANFWIPGPLRSMTGGSDQVEVETTGSTLKDALEALFRAHPGLRDRIFTERGEVREHVNVFVGKTEARWTGGLATPLADSAHISILPAISGGLGVFGLSHCFKRTYMSACICVTAMWMHARIPIFTGPLCFFGGCSIGSSTQASVLTGSHDTDT